MNQEQIITQLANQAEAVRSLVQGVSAEQARWKPAADAWSILEVVNHLYDEEREDFRRHLDDVLHHPTQPWHPIAPGDWVAQRGYNLRNLPDSLSNFLREREQSLHWLSKLPPPEWQVETVTPWGSISAGDLAASWLAHDLLHLRQIIELHCAWTVERARSHQVEYAGEW